MLRLARFSTRRPFVAFAAWFTVAAILAAIGLGVSHSLSPTIVVVPGSETARAEQLAESNFGPSVLVPIMLEGPKAQLDTQGPALVKALAARRDTRVLSAWDVGDTGAALRPDATHAMIVASVAQTEEAMVDGIQQDIDRHRRPAGLLAGDAVHHRHADDRPGDEGPVARRHSAGRAARAADPLPRAPVDPPRAGRGARPDGLRRRDDAHELRRDGPARQGHRRRPDGGGARLDGGARARRQLRDARLPALALRARARSTRTTAPARRSPPSRAVETTGRAVLIGGTALVVALALTPLIGPNTILISLGIGATLCSALAIGGAVVVMPAAADDPRAADAGVLVRRPGAS